MAEGSERVTMRRIAEAIEYSPTAIYNHFQDKDALLNSLCEDEFTRLFRRPGHGHAAPERGGLDTASRACAYARFGLGYPNHYRFMFMTKGAFGEDHEPSAPAREAFGLLRAAVKKAIETGEFRRGDVDAMAQVLWSSIHGAVALLITYRPQQFPGAPAKPDLVERVVENGIRGFLASPRTTRRKGR